MRPKASWATDPEPIQAQGILLIIIIFIHHYYVSLKEHQVKGTHTPLVHVGQEYRHSGPRNINTPSWI